MSDTVEMSRPTALDEESVRALGERLRGQLIRPGDGEYEQARLVWNGMIDRRPALIARCAGTEDVVEAVNFAREHGLLVAVRGGGHNVAGHATSDGGIVIDLSPMRKVEVDAERRIVRAGGGALWADVDAATQVYGLAAPGGLVSDTGIAGLTLGGGLGWLRRKHGLSCDNLIGAEVVTAGGRVVYASESENFDLLWGLRGGGGNFGVVTRFEFMLHPAGPEVMAAIVFYPVESARQALRGFRDYTATAPDEVGAVTFFGTIPAAEAYPAELHGRRYLAVGAPYIGPIEEAERALQPLRELAEPMLDLSGPVPFVDLQKMFDEDYPAHTMRYYWKSAFLPGLDDAAIDELIELNERRPSAHSTLDLWHLGGAIARSGPDDSAFTTRHYLYMVAPESNWEHPEEDEENIAWTREVVKQMEREAQGKRYYNFPGLNEEDDSDIQATFDEVYERLVALKNKYDPANLFRLNQNIKPSV
jgi:FAD/FMN-containing dehydrogenase